MSKKKALVTGITGQDGAYLAKFLVGKGYKVYGGYRRSSTPNFWRLEYLDVKNQVDLVSMDLLDQNSILSAIQYCEPDEIYNLASQSFVDVSFKSAIVTGEITGLGVTRVLDSIRVLNPKIKFYQASTSEMFGDSPPPQNEDSPFCPNSPYAAAKLYAHWVTKSYRTAYNLFACCGILFNHESPLRGIEFVTRKITDGVAKIKTGQSDKICLGNLEAKRDWGYAGDYVEAMWLMLQQSKPDDYVVATGQSHTVKEFCQEAFACAGMDWKKHLTIDKKYLRPNDIQFLLGDSTKAKKKLGWRPKVFFKDLVKMMVRADLEKYRQPTNHNRRF